MFMALSILVNNLNEVSEIQSNSDFPGKVVGLQNSSAFQLPTAFKGHCQSLGFFSSLKGHTSISEMIIILIQPKK